MDKGFSFVEGYACAVLQSVPCGSRAVLGLVAFRVYTV